MIQNKVLITFVAIFLFTSSIATATDITSTTENNIYQSIAKENLKSLNSIKPYYIEQDSSLNSLISDEKYFHDIVKEKLHEQLNLNPLEKRRLVSNILSSSKDEGETKNTVLDETTWQDLEMLCGPKSNPEIYLASKIDRTSTEIGTISLYKKIVSPTANAKQLIEQQNIIKELVENEKLFNLLDTNLQQLSIPENAILSFWKEDIFENIINQQMIVLPISIPKNISDFVLKNESIQELFNRQSFFSLLFGSLSSAVGIGTLSALGYMLFLDKTESIKPTGFARSLKKFNKPLGVSAAGTLGFLFFINFFLKNKKIEGGMDITSGLIESILIPHKYHELKNWFEINKCMQEKLIHVSTFVQNLVKMDLELQRQKNSKHLTPAIQKLDTAIKNLYKKSKDTKHLLQGLSTPTFKGKPSAFFTWWGRIDVVYRLMCELKNEFKHILLAIGEIDAYVSIAKLYKELQHEHVNFCFPEYDFSTQTPSIDIENFWNPFVDDKKVVPNSLTIGNKYTEPQNIIISGPNAAGKSTITKGLIISIILAQSIGIAPASKLTFTPFNKIITYLNITDDIASGNSHFKAGVKRSRELYNTVENLNENEKSLMAVDELFNGTTYKEGQAAAYSFIKQLGYNTKNICITATHFPNITKLEEQTGLFTNYKVTVSENGKITYPYKLEKGISNQIITFRILKEEGFNDEFLTEAEEQLMES